MQTGSFRFLEFISPNSCIFQTIISSTFCNINEIHDKMLRVLCVFFFVFCFFLRFHPTPAVPAGSLRCHAAANGANAKAGSSCCSWKSIQGSWGKGISYRIPNQCILMERPRKFPWIFDQFWWAGWCQLPRLVFLEMDNLHTVPKRLRDSQHVQYKNVSFGVFPLLGFSWCFVTDFLEFWDDYTHVMAKLYWLSQWLTFKLLGITYLIGQIKFKLFFRGPLAE